MILKTCKHFDTVGNRCSRVTDGKCDNLPDCEFKYIEALKAENETLKSQLDYEVQKKEVLEAKNEKYKQTLQKIKAIAETCMSKDACYECKYCDNCYIEDAEFPTYDICKLLIELITKAESEE